MFTLSKELGIYNDYREMKYRPKRRERGTEEQEKHLEAKTKLRSLKVQADLTLRCFVLMVLCGFLLDLPGCLETGRETSVRGRM